MERREMIWWIVGLLIAAPFILFYFPILSGADNAYIVRSGSMEPEIPTGSVIFVKDVAAESIGKGDVITFRRDSGGGVPLTTHRVTAVRIEEGNYSFKTKGDANEDPDPGWVHQNRVVGVEHFTVPLAGFALAWTRTTQGFLTLVLVPAAVIAFSELRKIFLELSSDIESIPDEMSVALDISIALLALSGVVSLFWLSGTQISGTQAILGAIILILIAMGDLILKPRLSKE